ncbi:hypothetical protein UXP88_19485, partial [Enterobacter hormaechei]|nr:hypothetical protein [Enterobacter hormaechei]HBL6016240.1 hypothetical protein [Enterobacter hormaechei]HBL6130799.1 hypothetical protein [Enterobacter hormaechei]HBL8998175.1 hypothetical protein [Enterobacter hormaechei]HBL9016809.1 hypothetical protein [Enterobacter hormaechei]
KTTRVEPEDEELRQWCLANDERRNHLYSIAERIAQRNNQEGRTVYLHKGAYDNKPTPEAINQATARLSELGIERITDDSVIDREAAEIELQLDNLLRMKENANRQRQMLIAFKKEQEIKAFMKNSRKTDRSLIRQKKEDNEKLQSEIDVLEKYLAELKAKAGMNRTTE